MNLYFHSQWQFLLTLYSIYHAMSQNIQLNQYLLLTVQLFQVCEIFVNFQSLSLVLAIYHL